MCFTLYTNKDVSTIILFLQCCNQTKMVVWKSSHAGQLCISNGVKQEMILFSSMYLDELLKLDLHVLNSGCYMNGTFVGVVIYDGINIYKYNIIINAVFIECSIH